MLCWLFGIEEYNVRCNVSEYRKTEEGEDEIKQIHIWKAGPRDTRGNKMEEGHGFEMDGNIILIMILICVYLQTEQNIFVFH